MALEEQGRAPAEEIHLNVDTQDSSLCFNHRSLSISALFWLLSDALRMHLCFPGAGMITCEEVVCYSLLYPY